MDSPKRKSPRIPRYDYATPNYYFITICTANKKCIFGKPGNLNRFGIIAKECLLKIPVINHDIRIDKYVVMPNHIHAIMVIERDGLQKSIPQIIGQYKMAVTKIILLSGKKIASIIGILWSEYLELPNGNVILRCKITGRVDDPPLLMIRS